MMELGPQNLRFNGIYAPDQSLVAMGETTPYNSHGEEEGR